MPQVDKVTFFPIVLWTFLLYVGGYLFLNTTVLFAFFAQLKLNVKRTLATYYLSQLLQRLAGALTFFAWIAL